MKTVTILSGIPGSGKSTLAARLVSTAPVGSAQICSADDFHLDEKGVYRFDPKKIGEAHDRCLLKFLDWLDKGVENIIVDNTNLSSWEIAPYYRLGEAHRYSTKVVRIWCDPLVAAQRNIHDVPLDRVFQMYQKFLQIDLPPHWKTVTFPSPLPKNIMIGG